MHYLIAFAIALTLVATPAFALNQRGCHGLGVFSKGVTKLANQGISRHAAQEMVDALARDLNAGREARLYMQAAFNVVYRSHDKYGHLDPERIGKIIQRKCLEQ